MRGDHTQIEKNQVQVLGISVDHIYAHRAFSHSLGDLPFPLMADWHKSVSRTYRVLDEKEEMARRSLFLLDYRGYVRWRNPKFRVRDPQEYGAMLEAMAALARIPQPKQS